MKAQQDFADFPTSDMLKELGFELEITDTLKAYDKHGEDVNWSTKHFYCYKPLWQQIEEWLWNKHGITIYHVRVEKNYYGRATQNEFQILPVNAMNPCDSPITAEREGIKHAVKYLHEKIKK